jgi:phage major head subunit gpT-like protein
MIINQKNLQNLFTGYKTAFNGGFEGVKPSWNRVATPVPSTTAAEQYAWLGQMPRIREWLGDRVVQNIATHGYTVSNKEFESTIAVKRSNIEDDNYGVFTPLMTELGRSTAVFPDELVFALLRNGFADLCYDKKPMFSADHIVLNERAKEVKVSNVQTGTEAPWFLLDTSRALKPFIYQTRKKFDFVAKQDPRTSDHVFMANEYVYGVDGRSNGGYGFWQMAYGSTQPLTKEHLRAARRAMMQQTGDHGRPLGIKPTLLVIGTSNSDAARDILLAERLESGASNVDRNLVEIFETPWLA